MGEPLIDSRAWLVGQIRALVAAQWPPTGNPSTWTRELVRAHHWPQRRQLLQREAPFIAAELPRLITVFAGGSEIDPKRIDPVVVPVRTGSVEAKLFRLVTALWSVPVSRGFGRRMRFLVYDQFNHKLIGVFALGDPVFNLHVRDRWIGWDVEQRRARLVCVMDGYVVGAVPPYNMLLGGKLVASLIASREVADEFANRYGGTRGRISGERKHASLAAVTITSALGRSSVYNRMKLKGMLNLERLGETKGYGHFHVSDPLFALMRELLSFDRHPYANGYSFGDGPSWRMRVIREALRRAELDDGLIRHGIGREVFGMALAENWREYLRGHDATCRGNRLTARELAEAALYRWVMPRSRRNDQYRDWPREKTENTFLALLDHVDPRPSQTSTR